MVAVETWLTERLLAAVAREKPGVAKVTYAWWIGAPVESFAVTTTGKFPPGVDVIVLIVNVDVPDPDVTEVGLRLTVTPTGAPVTVALRSTVPL